MAKKRSNRSGRITLRLEPERHAELAYIADVLGLDLNGLIRLMIAHQIGHYRMEALTLEQQQAEDLNLLKVWQETNPGRPIREFWVEYWHRQLDRRMMEAMKLAGHLLFEPPAGQDKIND